MSGEPQTFGWPPQPTSGATQPIPGFAAPGFAASLVSTLGATAGCRACAGRHVAHTCPKRRPKKRALTELPTNEVAKRRDTLVSTTKPDDVSCFVNEQLLQRLRDMEQLLQQVRVASRQKDSEMQALRSEWERERDGYMRTQSVRWEFICRAGYLRLAEESFHVVDTEGTGVIGKEQVRRLVQDLGKELSEEELDAAMAAMDDDGNGTVGFFRFFDWWRAEHDISSEQAETTDEPDEGCTDRL